MSGENSADARYYQWETANPDLAGLLAADELAAVGDANPEPSPTATSTVEEAV